MKLLAGDEKMHFLFSEADNGTSQDGPFKSQETTEVPL